MNYLVIKNIPRNVFLLQETTSIYIYRNSKKDVFVISNTLSFYEFESYVKHEIRIRFNSKPFSSGILARESGSQ